MAFRGLPDDRLNESFRRLVSRAVDLVPETLRNVIAKSHDEDVMLFAGGLAFHALVSVAPLMIVVLWITSLIVGDDEIERFATNLGEHAPAGLGAGDALRKVGELGTEVGVPSLIAALWPATAYGSGVRRGFARLAHEERRLKGLRGRGLILIVLLPLFVIGALLGSYFGAALLDAEGVGLALGGIVAFLAAFGAGGLSIALMYRIFTTADLSWRSIWEAALYASAAISVISVAFALYLSLGANFEDHYATSGIAGIVLLGVWLFLANTLLLVGYQLAIERERKR